MNVSEIKKKKYQNEAIVMLMKNMPIVVLVKFYYCGSWSFCVTNTMSCLKNCVFQFWSVTSISNSIMQLPCCDCNLNSHIKY